MRDLIISHKASDTRLFASFVVLDLANDLEAESVEVAVVLDLRNYVVFADLRGRLHWLGYFFF